MLLNPALSLLMARYLRSRRGFTAVVTWFSVVGIALGVGALLIVLAVMSGFRQELIDRILGATGHAQVQVVGLTLPAAEAMAAELRQIQGVETAVPYVTGQVLVSSNGHAVGAVVRGIPVGALAPDFAKHLEDPKAGWAADGVLVGVRLAGNIGVGRGDGVVLLSPNGQRTIAGMIPRSAQMPVANVFDMGMMQLDSGLVLMPMEAAQDLLKKGPYVDAVEVRVRDPRAINDLVPLFQRVAGQFAGSPADVSVRTWMEDNADFMRALQVERMTMFIILSLIVVVAAFNVITGQMMLVNDKLGDIAILRSMGATQRGILALFMGNGLLLGAVGTAAGLALGMLGIYNMMRIIHGVKALTGIDLFPGDVYFLDELPGRVSWPDVWSVLILTGILTVVASVYPAWRASRYAPVDLLRQG